MKKLIVFLDLENTLSIPETCGIIPEFRRYRTLCHVWHEEFINDSPNTPLIGFLNNQKDKLMFYLVSGKSEKYRDLVSKWIKKHVPFSFEKIILQSNEDQSPTALLKENAIGKLIKTFDNYPRDHFIFIDDIFENRANINNSFDIRTFKPNSITTLKTYISSIISKDNQIKKEGKI